MQFYIDPGSQFTLRGLDFGRIQYSGPVPRHGNHNEFQWSQFHNKESLWFFLVQPLTKCDETISVLLTKLGTPS